MKVMIRKTPEGQMSLYVPKKDLEEPIVAMEKPEMWGGVVTLQMAGGSNCRHSPRTPSFRSPSKRANSPNNHGIKTLGHNGNRRAARSAGGGCRHAGQSARPVSEAFAHAGGSLGHGRGNALPAI